MQSGVFPQRAHDAYPRASHPLQQVPGGFVPFDAECSRKTESAHAMLLRDKTPECLEPESEWYTTVTEDGACRHRNITTTLLALQDVAADCPHVRLCTMGASRDSVPTDLCYVLPTCLVRGELIDEILHRLRILYCHASV